MEEFRDLDFAYPYKVSNKGTVVTMFGAFKGSVKKQNIDKSGDATVNIWNGNKQKPKKVYKLVLRAFFGEKNPHVRVRHKDGNKKNNSVDNLEIIRENE